MTDTRIDLRSRSWDDMSASTINRACDILARANNHSARLHNERRQRIRRRQRIVNAIWIAVALCVVWLAWRAI